MRRYPRSLLVFCKHSFAVWAHSFPSCTSRVVIHLLSPMTLFRVRQNQAELCAVVFAALVKCHHINAVVRGGSSAENCSREHPGVLWKAGSAVDPAGRAAGDPAPVPAAPAEHGRSCCKTVSWEVFLQHRHTVPPVSTADKVSTPLRALFISFHWIFPILVFQWNYKMCCSHISQKWDCLLTVQWLLLFNLPNEKVSSGIILTILWA